MIPGLERKALRERSQSLAQGDLNRAVSLPGTKGGGRRGPEQEGGWGRAGWLPGCTGVSREAFSACLC